jgi:hypothetical protein
MYQGDPDEKLSLDDTLLALRGLMSGEPDLVANAANCAALLAAQLDDVNWLGFYFLQGTNWCWARSRAFPPVCASRWAAVFAGQRWPRV